MIELVALTIWIILLIDMVMWTTPYFLFGSKGPITSKFTFFKDICWNKLIIDTLLAKHNKWVEKMFSLRFYQLFIMMKGDIKLLQQWQRLEPKWNVVFSKVYRLQSFCLHVLIHNCWIFCIHFWDEIWLYEESSHLSIVE